MYCNIDVNMWKNTEAVSVFLQDVEVFFSIDIDNIFLKHVYFLVPLFSPEKISCVHSQSYRTVLFQ